MMPLANYTQIAELVKDWSEKLKSLDLTDPTHQLDLGVIAQDMHAFSNGLQAAVEIFGPIVANDNGENVAKSKIVQVQLSNAGTGEVLQRHTMSDNAFGWSIAFDVEGTGRMRIDALYPHKFPMVPEEV